MDLTLCRLCYENIGVTSLFDTTDSGEHLSEKVKYCAKVYVSQEDCLPANICECCENELAATCRFLNKCEQTDKKLRSLQTAVKEESESKDEVKIENLVDNPIPGDSFVEPDESYDSPLPDDIKEARETKTKQKYVRRKSLNSKSSEPNESYDSPFETKRKYVIRKSLSRKSNEPNESYNSSFHDDVKEEKPETKTKQKYVKRKSRNRKSSEPNESYDSPFSDDVKDEAPEMRTKRKYVRRKPLKRKLSKVGQCKCNVCGRLCGCPSALVVHMRSHTNEKPHSCPTCEKCYKDGGTLKRHIARNHDPNRPRSYVCENCGKAFYSKSDCKIHMRIHTGEKPHACKKCEARFTQIGALSRHKLTHTGEKAYMCSRCSKTFSTPQQLKIHYVVHSEEKRFKCHLCDLLFKHNYTMKKHIKRHADEISKRFICDYCHRNFLYKINLKTHIQNMHSSKSGHCSECSKHFANIQMHMLKHAGVKTFKCELCTSSFYYARGLSKHINFQHKHTEKYKCTVNDCTLCFPSRQMLEYHITRYHKSIKPFTCDRCPRSFYRRSDMVRHKKGTHKEYLAELKAT